LFTISEKGSIFELPDKKLMAESTKEENFWDSKEDLSVD